MSIFEVEAESRTDMGKGASRRLRRDGKVPAVMYGGDTEPQSISLVHSEILKSLEHEAFYSHILTVKVDGQATKAVLRDMQRHPSKPYIMHMDFQRINEKESIRVHVPLHFVGGEVAPGVKTGGGMVNHEVIEVELEVLPRHLPEFIEVDISGLHVGDSLHLSDLKLPETGTLIELARGEDHDQTVVSVQARRGGGEEAEENGGDEGEVAEDES
jgi:large subunit ribosomal protein L25